MFFQRVPFSPEAHQTSDRLFTPYTFFTNSVIAFVAGKAGSNCPVGCAQELYSDIKMPFVPVVSLE